MKKNVTIDRLRGFSVLIVICMHATFFFPSVLTFLGTALGNGYYGVTAFFCTSGFLITTNQLKRYGRVANVDLYAFYVMRFARIVPPLVLLILSLWLLSLTTLDRFHFPPPLTLKDNLIATLLLRYNHYYKHGGFAMLTWSILWSLSIEEVFYLAYPITAKVVRWTWPLIGVLIAVVIDAIIHRRGNIYTLYDYFGCFDGIALGALSALAAQRFRERVPRWLAWIVMLVGIGVLVGTYWATNVTVQYNLGLTLIASGAALLLFASQYEPFASTRVSSYDPLAFIGRISYEIYLFHMTVFALVSSVVIPQYPVIVFAIGMVCAIAVSDAVARLYAEPLNRGLRSVLLGLRRTRAGEPSLAPSPLVSTGGEAG